MMQNRCSCREANRGVHISTLREHRRQNGDLAQKMPAMRTALLVSEVGMANKSLCVLGRQPALGFAELEGLYGADNLRPIGDVAALLYVDPPQIDFSRLGGTVKFCKLLTILDTTKWQDIQKFLE